MELRCYRISVGIIISLLGLMIDSSISFHFGGTQQHRTWAISNTNRLLHITRSNIPIVQTTGTGSGVSVSAQRHVLKQQQHFYNNNMRQTMSVQRIRRLDSMYSTTAIRDSIMDDFDNNDNSQNNNNKDDDDTMLFSKLRQRVQEINQKERTLVTRLRNANCTSKIAVAIPDWIRRLNVGTYPIVVCGSASSTIFVAHLETGTVLATNEAYLKRQQSNVGDNYDTDTVNAHTIRLLYGQYDGGGTISIAMSSLNGPSTTTTTTTTTTKGAIIAEGRRSGGVGIYRFDINSPELIYQGSIPNLNNCIATSLTFDNDNNLLWIGTDNGQILAYSTESESDTTSADTDYTASIILPPLVVQTKPKYKWNVTSTVLSLSVNTDLSYAVATTESGYIYLLSLDNYNNNANDKEGQTSSSSPIQSFLPPYDSTERRPSPAYCTCATLVLHPLSSATSIIPTSPTISSVNQYSIVCGTNDGTIYVQSLNLRSNNNGDGTTSNNLQTTEINFNNPFADQKIRKMMPNHFGGAVKCIVAIPNSDGLVASCGYDGSLRIWDVSSKDNLYQFLGYKVWIGSIWTDGIRLVSDGADNTIIMHDFSIPTTSTTTNKNNNNNDNSSNQK